MQSYSFFLEIARRVYSPLPHCKNIHCQAGVKAGRAGLFVPPDVG